MVEAMRLISPSRAAVARDCSETTFSAVCAPRAAMALKSADSLTPVAAMAPDTVLIMKVVCSDDKFIAKYAEFICSIRELRIFSLLFNKHQRMKRIQKRQ